MSETVLRGFMKEAKTKYYDYSDASLRVATMYGGARFGHEHAAITDLEFATIEDDDPKKQLLECDSSLLRGHGELFEFQFLCDEYCKKRNRKNWEV